MTGSEPGSARPGEPAQPLGSPGAPARARPRSLALARALAFARALARAVAFALALAIAFALALALAAGLGGRAALPAAPAQVSGRTAFRGDGHGPLLAGAARAPLHPVAHGPIAGFPARRRDDGAPQALEASALALRVPGLTQLFVSLPLLFISPALEEELVLRLGPQPGTCLLVTATHTHAGPGGTWDSLLVELGGNGLFDRAQVDALAAAGAEAAQEALAALAPASLKTAQVAWPEGPAAARSGGSIDPTLTAVRAEDPAGRALGTLVVYAMHPTVVPRKTTRLSGDWPEAAARELRERTGAPGLILQGAVGDATWSREGLPLEDTEATLGILGARVAARAGEVLAQVPPRDPDVRLWCETRLVALPAPQGGQALNPLVRGAATFALSRAAPAAALATTLGLPGLELWAVPAEPVGQLALELRARSAVPLAVVSLADGYAGYAETEARARAGKGESARTWYGPDLARALGLSR